MWQHSIDMHQEKSVGVSERGTRLDQTQNGLSEGPIFRKFGAATV
jgi:hypothetical protein